MTDDTGQPTVDMAPCPFCGCDESPVLVVKGGIQEEACCAFCSECGARGPSTVYSKTSRNDVEDLERQAFAEWNRRAEPQPTVDRLIAQLEAASHGSSELNCEIQKAIDPHGRVNPAPDWTGSLDVALTLLPEGWGFKADCGLGYGYRFTVGHVGANKLYDQPEGRGEAATPALALCIAALRARQISQRETGAPL